MLPNSQPKTLATRYSTRIHDTSDAHKRANTLLPIVACNSVNTNCNCATQALARTYFPTWALHTFCYPVAMLPNVFYFGDLSVNKPTCSHVRPAGAAAAPPYCSTTSAALCLQHQTLICCLKLQQSCTRTATAQHSPFLLRLQAAAVRGQHKLFYLAEPIALLF